MAKAQTNITWQAAEYIVRDHDVWWYIGLIVITIALCALSVWQSWWSFLVLVLVCDLAILTSNLRPPRTLQYSLSNAGLKEGNRLHKLEDFKAFGILKEGTHFSAILIPKKRLGVSVKVYFPEGSGEAIVDYLGARLPMEEVKPDLLDKIVNFLRI